jgi:hypothetical protein
MTRITQIKNKEDASRSHAERGNARWDALRPVPEKPRRRASLTCVPTQSVGTRNFFFYRCYPCHPWFVWLLLLLLCCCGCRKPISTPLVGEPADPPWFRDVTAESGVDFLHDAGPTGTFFLPQIVGSGAAVLDFDGDGLLDLYFLTNGGPKSPSTNRLFRQLPGGRFQDVSSGSGLDIRGHNMGVAVGDVDNDGRPDVLVTQYHGLRLFHNDGGGRFSDITELAGLHSPLWGASAAFFDYDRDGWLDLLVVNYIDYDPSKPCSTGRGQRDYCGPAVFDGSVTKLFHNRGAAASGGGDPPRGGGPQTGVAPCWSAPTGGLRPPLACAYSLRGHHGGIGAGSEVGPWIGRALRRL